MGQHKKLEPERYDLEGEADAGPLGHSFAYPSIADGEDCLAHFAAVALGREQADKNTLINWGYTAAGAGLGVAFPLPKKVAGNAPVQIGLSPQEKAFCEGLLALKATKGGGTETTKIDWRQVATLVIQILLKVLVA